MRVGMIGLGRMGANMVRRLLRDGHECIAYDRDAAAVEALAAEGAVGADSLQGLVASLPAPRAIWIMVPAAVVDRVIADLQPLVAAGDSIIDGGNTHYREDIRRARELGDVWHPSGSVGPDAVKRVKERYPQLRVVPRTGADQVDAFLDAGAEGAVVSIPDEASLRDFVKRYR